MTNFNDFQAGIERVSDQLIRDAMAEGKFSHLPGAGKPLPGIDEPFDEHWWVRAWVKREKLAQPTLARELRACGAAAPDAAEAHRGTADPREDRPTRRSIRSLWMKVSLLGCR